MVTRQLLGVAVAALRAAANPVPRPASATLLSQDQIDLWAQPAYLAGAAYCDSDQITEWDCGEPCEKVSTPPKVVATGGDNGATPLWFVAQNGTHVIVSIAGTNPLSWRSIYNVVTFGLTEVDAGWFPDASDVRVSHGFITAFGRMQEGIHTAVKAEVEAGIKDVLVVGHSQGGALGHLAAVNIQRTIPESKVTARMFAAPRIGNQEWADYLDATLGDNTMHMTNRGDYVPQLPPADWGFAHSSNEVWVQDGGSNTYIACPGGESKECQAGLGITGHMRDFVESLDALVHLGPYAGVRLGRLKCKFKPLF